MGTPKTNRRLPKLTHHYPLGGDRREMLIVSGSGDPRIEGEWLRREDPAYVKRVTVEELGKIPFEEVLKHCQAGAQKLIVEYEVKCFADVPRIGQFVTAWEWTTKDRK